MIPWIVGLVFAIGIQQPVEPAPEPGAKPELPVSLARIESALERPARLRLTLPDARADFRIEIRQRALYSPNLLGPVENLWSATPRPAPRGGLYALEQRQRTGGQWSQPMVSVDLLSLGAALHRAIVRSLRSQ